MNGYTLRGAGTNSGFYMSGINHKNIILQNGVIDNWNRGVDYYQGSTTDANLPFTIRNVTFTNNVQDVYSSAGTTKDILIEDSYFYNSLYLAALRTAVLRNNHIDLSSQLYMYLITDILFENNPSLKADYLYYYAVTNFNVTSDDSYIYLNNLCGSTFANTGNSILRIKLQGNYNNTGNCIDIGSNGDTRNNIILMEEQIEKLENLINKQEERIKELEYKLERHKHSGKDTADINNILQERLGLKMGTFTSMTGTDNIYFDFAGVLKSIGRAQLGEAKVYSLLGQYFGIEWTGGGEPYFTTDAEMVLPFFASDPTAIDGSIYYNTGTNKVKVCEDGVWKTITTT